MFHKHLLALAFDIPIDTGTNGGVRNRLTAAISGVNGTTMGSAGGNQAMQQHNHALGNSTTVRQMIEAGLAGGAIGSYLTGDWFSASGQITADITPEPAATPLPGIFQLSLVGLMLIGALGFSLRMRTNAEASL